MPRKKPKTPRKQPRQHPHTKEELEWAFHLDWYTWQLSWRIPLPQAALHLGITRSFGPITTKDAKGHLVVTFETKKYFVSHIIWMMTHEGRWPKGRLLHRDKDKLNNKPSNLRDTGILEPLYKY